MAQQYNYNKYVQWCSELDLKQHLPDFFEKFVDGALFTANQIAKVTGVHKETVLRWFRDAKLTNQSASNAYMAEGSDIKQHFFNRQTTISPIKRKYPEFFQNKEHIY